MSSIPRLKTALAIALTLGVPLVASGCKDNPLDDVCCTDFKVGADLSGADFGVDADIKGQFSVLAQAGSDFSATATGMIDDVTNACRGIAQDLGAADADQTAADANTEPKARV